jgi:hypothetical protein
VDVWHRNLQLAKLLCADLAEFRRESERFEESLSSMEGVAVRMSADLAQIRSDLGDIRANVSHIKRGLGINGD